MIAFLKLDPDKSLLAKETLTILFPEKSQFVQFVTGLLPLKVQALRAACAGAAMADVASAIERATNDAIIFLFISPPL